MGVVALSGWSSLQLLTSSSKLTCAPRVEPAEAAASESSRRPTDMLSALTCRLDLNDRISCPISRQPDNSRSNLPRRSIVHQQSNGRCNTITGCLTCLRPRTLRELIMHWKPCEHMSCRPQVGVPRQRLVSNAQRVKVVVITVLVAPGTPSIGFLPSRRRPNPPHQKQAMPSRKLTATGCHFHLRSRLQLMCSHKQRRGDRLQRASQ